MLSDIPKYTCNNRAWTRDDPTEPTCWFSVCYRDYFGEGIGYIDLAPLHKGEHNLNKGRFENYINECTDESFIIVNKDLKADAYDDLLNWCGENIKHQWGMSINKSKVSKTNSIETEFHFSNSEDAAFFKLTIE